MPDQRENEAPMKTGLKISPPMPYWVDSSVPESALSIEAWLADLKIYYQLSKENGQEASELYKKYTLVQNLGECGIAKFRPHPIYQKWRESETTYEALEKAVEETFRKVTSQAHIGFKLFTTHQAVGEAVNDYIGRMQMVAREFKIDADVQKTRDKLLAVALQIGCSDKAAKEELCRQEEADLQNVIRTLKAAESARSEAKILGGEEYGIKKLKKNREFQSRSRKSSSSSGSESERNGSCGKCGGRHPPQRCPARNKECYQCGKIGHFGRKCRNLKGEKEVKQIRVRCIKLATKAQPEQENVLNRGMESPVKRAKNETQQSVLSTYIPVKEYEQKILRDPTLDMMTKCYLIHGPQVETEESTDGDKIRSASDATTESGPEEEKSSSEPESARLELEVKQHQTSLAMGTLGLEERHQMSLAVEHAHSETSSVGERALGDGRETIRGTQLITTEAEVHSEQTAGRSNDDFTTTLFHGFQSAVGGLRDGVKIVASAFGRNGRDGVLHKS